MLLMSTFMYLYVCLLIHSYIHEEIVHMKRPPLLPQDLSFFSRCMYLFQQHITSLIHDLIEVQPTSLLIIKIITLELIYSLPFL